MLYWDCTLSDYDQIHHEHGMAFAVMRRELMIAVHSRTSVAGCLSSLYLREHDSVVATGGSVILATAKIFERTTYSKLRKEYLQG
jgi:hypothetical protein